MISNHAGAHVGPSRLALCPQPWTPEARGTPFPGEGGEAKPGSPRGGRSRLLLPTAPAASSAVFGQSAQVLIKIYWAHEMSKKMTNIEKTGSIH